MEEEREVPCMGRFSGSWKSQTGCDSRAGSRAKSGSLMFFHRKENGLLLAAEDGLHVFESLNAAFAVTPQLLTAVNCGVRYNVQLDRTDENPKYIN